MSSPAPYRPVIGWRQGPPSPAGVFSPPELLLWPMAIPLTPHTRPSVHLQKSSSPHSISEQSCFLCTGRPHCQQGQFPASAAPWFRPLLGCGFWGPPPQSWTLGRLPCPPGHLGLHIFLCQPDCFCYSAQLMALDQTWTVSSRLCGNCSKITASSISYTVWVAGLNTG